MAAWKLPKRTPVHLARFCSQNLHFRTIWPVAVASLHRSRILSAFLGGARLYDRFRMAFRVLVFIYCIFVVLSGACVGVVSHWPATRGQLLFCLKGCHGAVGFGVLERSEPRCATPRAKKDATKRATKCATKRATKLSGSLCQLCGAKARVHHFYTFLRRFCFCLCFRLCFWAGFLAGFSRHGGPHGPRITKWRAARRVSLAGVATAALR